MLEVVIKSNRNDNLLVSINGLVADAQIKDCVSDLRLNYCGLCCA